MQAVIYARVSSKEQEQQGFSIPAQLKFLNEYALREGIEVVRQYSDSETAKKVGRTNFNNMLEFLKENPSIKTLLVEKTDRLYRNFKDYVLLEDYDLEVHLVKEGSIMSKDSRSHDKFIHGIKVLMAKNYIDNLSEEVSKGFKEAIEEGIWPFKLPFGYVRGKNKEAIIDDSQAVYIRKAFELYANEGYSLRKLARVLYEHGYIYTEKTPIIHRSTLEGILKNVFYIGKIQYHNEIFPAGHAPLISLDLFEAAQESFRKDNKPLYHKVEMFAYPNMIKCGECGYYITAEFKKNRYKYYHCTHTNNSCSQRHYLLEEELTKQLLRAIERIAITDEHLEWIKEALKESLKDETEFHNEQVEETTARIHKLEEKLKQMYLDKLDGNIDNELWKEFKNSIQMDIGAIRINQHKHTRANVSYMDYGVNILEACRKARLISSKLKKYKNLEEISEFLKEILDEITLKDGKISYKYKKPFDLFAKGLSCTKNWALRDSNSRPSRCKRDALPTELNALASVSIKYHVQNHSSRLFCKISIFI